MSKLKCDMFESLKLHDLSRRQKAILRPAAPTRPALRIIEEDGMRAVVKDFSSNRFLFRNLAGRFLVWRESRAYRQVAGLEGVPRIYRTIKGLAIVLEEIPGTNLNDVDKETDVSGAFFEACEELVSRVHARGVAHCDLKREPNILVGADGRPYIVDWAAAILERECRFFPLNRIYQRFLRDDELAIIKLKLKHCADAVSKQERKLLEYRSGPERAIRAVRDRLRKFLRHIA
jgi:serine/threonine protein kinase